MSNNVIYEYRYLNSEIEKKRQESLLNYINNDSEEDLSFYGLDFFSDVNNKRSKILNVFRKSVLDESIILNDYQIELLSILNEHNLFLSAPTSFGKTFIVLEYLKRNETTIDNIVFIVPTLALMNELVKKIYKHFSSSYNICINAEEKFGKRNIFVFVPERSGETFIKSIKAKDIDIDLLIIDEMYKLRVQDSGKITTDGRIIVMNKAYLDMVKQARQIILLAPFVKDVKFEKTKLDIVKYYSNFCPVYNSIKSFDDDAWISLVRNTSEQSLIYFKSPLDMYNYLKKFIDAVPTNSFYSDLYKNEIDYLKSNYSSEWINIKLLERGYGVHHGNTPIFLRKFYETQYNSKKLKGLFCTSTLMEGINTPTQSLIIVGGLRDKFELNNLMGRVGRLTGKKPIIGNVYICNSSVKELYNNDTDGWLNLQILAERIKPKNNEEKLMLFDSNDLDDSEKKYKKELKLICEYSGKSEDDIKTSDVKFVRLLDFVNEDYRAKFNGCSRLYDAIQTSYVFIGQRLNRLFSKSSFKLIKDSKEKSFSAMLYLVKLLTGSTIKECVDDFNKNFNVTYNIDNINTFIDGLDEAVSYIKFELMKVTNYLTLFDVDIAGNDSLSKLCVLLSNFVDNNVAFKILDDLGIERSDFSKISSSLGLDENVSASEVIAAINKNKEKLLSNKELSPFTKHNIRNI